METVGTLITAIKRFVYNNSNAVDAFQGQQSGATMTTFMDAACLRAVNNARLYAERNGSFGWLDVTVAASFPVGMGINLNRLYLLDSDFDVSGAIVQGSFGATPDTMYRFDGKGVLYLAIGLNMTTLWGGSYLNLQSVSIATGSGQTVVDGLAVGEYQVWEIGADVTVAARVYHTYKMGHVKSGVTRPTNWAALYDTVGPAYFAEPIKLNATYAAEIVATDGSKLPLDIDTRQSQHIQNTQQLGRGTHPGFEANSTVARQLGLNAPKALIHGRELKLNFTNDTVLNVEITGSRWMKPYTVDADTDILIDEGFDFMMWQSIIELNHIVQIYVPRAEGSLPPPVAARNEAWASLLTNDAFASTSYYHQ